MRREWKRRPRRGGGERRGCVLIAQPTSWTREPRQLPSKPQTHSGEILAANTVPVATLRTIF